MSRIGAEYVWKADHFGEVRGESALNTTFAFFFAVSAIAGLMICFFGSFSRYINAAVMDDLLCGFRPPVKAFGLTGVY